MGFQRPAARDPWDSIQTTGTEPVSLRGTFWMDESDTPLAVSFEISSTMPVTP